MGTVAVVVFLALTALGVSALNAFRPGAQATTTSISQAQVAPAPSVALAVQEGITHGR
jgi:hypothetical protein